MQSIIKLLVAFLFIISWFEKISAQEDYGWWVEIHNWDGVTPWHQYMTISSAFLGPNALPVPEINNGKVDSTAQLQISVDRFSSRGDKTNDIYLKGILPLYNNMISMQIDVVPLEWYQLDTITRDIRAVRTRSGKGVAGGDIYVSTQIQLIKDRALIPDLLLRIALRSASGTHLRDARYTDAPGYFFDVSFGKNIYSPEKKIKEIRLYGDIGFYTYQTYDLQHLQDDCFLFGGGVTINSARLSWTNSIGGYSGYIKNGDHPVVYRSELKWLRKVVDIGVDYEWGINDYDYQRYRLSWIFHVDGKKIFKVKN